MNIGTIIKCVDNSGARRIKVIGRRGGRKPVKYGDRVAVSVKELKVNKNKNTVGSSDGVKVGSVCLGLVVGLRQWAKRKGALEARSGENYVILISKTKNGIPIGNRVSNVVPRELRTKGYSRIVTISIGVFL